MTQKAIDPKVIGVFVGFLILFFLMLILQCCLGTLQNNQINVFFYLFDLFNYFEGGRTTKKVTKRRARFGASYEDISQRIPASETARPRTFIPASAPVDTILETDIDGIVVIPELDEGLCKFLHFITIRCIFIFSKIKNLQFMK